MTTVSGSSTDPEEVAMTDGSSTPLSDDQRAHVASCLASSGLLVAPSGIAAVESDGWCVTFAGDLGGCVWVSPSTRRAIKEMPGVC